MGEKILISSVNYMAEFDKLRKEAIFVDCSLAAEGQYLNAHKAVLSAASAYFEMLLTQEHEKNPVIIFTNIRYNELEAVMRLIYQGEVEICEDGLAEFLNVVSFLQIDGIDHNKLVVRQTNVTTCDKGSSFIANETTSIPEAFFVSVKMEGEDTVSEIEDFVDNEHIAHNYLPLEESSQIMPSSDFVSNQSSVHTCEENILKSDLRDIESNLSSSTGQPACGYEFSSIVTDIEIKEPDEEISWVLKLESDNMAVRMEDECTLEDLNDDDDDKEVSPVQPDTNPQIENAAVKFESAVTVIGNGVECWKCLLCDLETSQRAVFNEHICSGLLESPFQLPHCSSSSIQSRATESHETKHMRGKPFESSGTTTLEKKPVSTNFVQKEGGENTLMFLQCTCTCSGKKDLVNHVCSLIVEEAYKCSQCTYACRSNNDLKIHMRTHTEEKPFNCSQCTYTCSRKDVLKIHMRTHTGEKPYKCSQCTYACTSNSNLKIHMRTHTGEKPYKCSQCTYAFRGYGNLRNHMRTHTGEKPFKCSQCTFASSRKNGLIKHIRTHTGEKPYKCSQCNYACSQKHGLKIHMHSHSSEKPFKCSQCTYSCTFKQHLIAHVATHTGEKPFKCSQCTYSCSSRHYLRAHMHTHTEEKPFTCSDCKYTGCSKGSFARHMRTHTGEKPFKCLQCTYAGGSRSELVRHMLTHTGEKPYKCSQCNYVCSLRQTLKTHMRTHTGEKPFKCSECTYTCTLKESWKIHMSTHTGEQPFKCSQCTYACSRKDDLTLHMRTHTGDNTFMCSQCSYVCCRKGLLIRHMRSHPVENPAFINK